tara:strand:- start:244 stop:414 length:171 start_codon:yes stop_codon:yes gene_type:complete
MPKKKTVIWMIIILSLLIYFLIGLGEGVTMMALVWMIPTLTILVYTLMMHDWKENE